MTMVRDQKIHGSSDAPLVTISRNTLQMKSSRFRSWLGTSDETSETKTCKNCEDLEKRLSNARVALVLADSYSERLTRAREDFVQKLGNQIRVPLHSVVGICGAIGQEIALTHDARAQIGIINETCSQILSTINELLQVTTGESGRMCMENVSFDPRRMMDQVFKLLTKKLIEKRVGRCVDVNKNVPRTLAGDVSRLRQCLFAIQDTLLEESRPGDVLEINMRVLDSDDRLIAFMPRSKRFIPCLYELKLRRAPEREIINMQQVDIEKEMEPQIVLSAELAQGLSGRLLRTQSYTAFHMVVHFRYPIGGSTPSIRYSTSRDPVDAETKFTILLYEENPVFLNSVCKNLAAKGHVVDIVRDAEEVISLVTAGTVHGTYDCVLVDTSEGGLHFIESLRAVEDRTGIGRMTILLSITYGLEGWERRYVDAGVDGHFLKPCSEQVIISRIKDAISAVNSLVSGEESSVSQTSSNNSVRLDT